MRTKTKSQVRSWTSRQDTLYSPTTGAMSETITERDYQSSITYEVGPKYHRGKLQWKYCDQTKGQWTPAGLTAYFAQSSYRGEGVSTRFWQAPNVSTSSPSIKPPTGIVLEDHMNDLRAQFDDQVDLNTGDSVLIYSGVLQAIPLVGGLVRANAVINRIGRWATKALRRRPFTEVVKAAISADFINRFVIRPTIDDLHKTADAVNYVIRKMDTLRARNNSAITAFRQSSTIVNATCVVQSGSRTTLPGVGAYTNGSGTVRTTDTALSEVQSYLLADVKYEEDQVSPIKLWMKRTGISTPLESIWDSIPFSFVADWFVRSGDFLTAVSQEMASDEGLKGKVMSIHDLWFTQKTVVRRTSEFSLTSPCGINTAGGWTPLVVQYPSTSVFEAGSFRRYRGNSDTFSRLGVWSDRGLISPQLTTTRTRTLAELVIQAKLR